MPTTMPTTNTSAYSSVRNGAAASPNTTNNTKADTPPMMPTSNSISIKRESASSSRMYLVRCAPMPMAKR